MNTVKLMLHNISIHTKKNHVGNCHRKTFEFFVNSHFIYVRAYVYKCYTFCICISYTYIFIYKLGGFVYST